MGLRVLYMHKMVHCVSSTPAQPDAVLKSREVNSLQRLAANLNIYANKKLGLKEASPRVGKALAALEAITPGELLLSLPMDATFQVTEEDGEESVLPWSICLALQVLAQRLVADRCYTLIPAFSQEEYAKFWSPTGISLPITDFSDEELQACQDADTIYTAQAIKSLLADATEVLAPDLDALAATGADLARAVKLVHSRNFVSVSATNAVTHVVAPGIDMANHSFSPTAHVRFHHSPEACQGLDALEEVCDSRSVQSSNACQVELLAAEGGIREGEEVTINYGNLPDDVFYLFFGFLPSESNEHNSVVLFGCIRELTAVLEPHCDSTAMAGLLAEDKTEDYNRLVATAVGFDRRAVEAAIRAISYMHDEILRERLSEEDRRRIPFLSQLGEQQVKEKALLLLAERCRQLYAAYPTSIEADKQLLKEDLPSKLALSVRYRLRKKLLLRHIIEQTSSRD